MRIREIVKNALKSVVFDACNEQLLRIERQNNELIYAQVWKDTIRDIEWVKDISSISPGRWAVGYNYLYVLTRVLEETRPHKVLDFGLGISTTLFSTYFNRMNFTDGIHTVVENNDEWKSFYSNNHKLSSCTTVYIKNLIKKNKEAIEYYAYDNISDIFMDDRKFEVISIDGPYGSDVIARRDIVDYLPMCLEKDFVIVMDDSERSGESNTILEIVDKLSSCGIKTFQGTYSGTSECTIITSESYSFLCTL